MVSVLELLHGMGDPAKILDDRHGSKSYACKTGTARSSRAAQQEKEGAQEPTTSGRPVPPFMGMVLPLLRTHLTLTILCCPYRSVFQIFSSSPRQLETRQKERASSNARGDSGWTAGRIFPQKR